MARMLQTANDHLVWEETTRGNIMDPSFVRERVGGLALYWAYCPVCGWADLFPCVSILQGKLCPWCAGIDFVRSYSRSNNHMLPLTGLQLEACAAFLVGGIEAVAAMTPPEVQRGGGHLQAAKPEAPGVGRTVLAAMPRPVRRR